MPFTISDSSPRAQYTAGAAQTVFTVAFEWRDDSDLKVYVNSALKTLNTDYTLVGAGISGGGTCTFTVARTAGEIIVIHGDMPIARTSDQYTTGGQLPAVVIEASFDDVTMKMKQVERDLGRSLRIGPSDTSDAGDFLLPIPATRANKYLSFDSAGRPALASSLGATVLSRAVIGGFMFPQSTAEVAAAITPTDYSYEWGNVLRYGIVPNSTAARAANISKLKALVNSDNERIADAILFPNTTGADTYYFGIDFAHIADGYLLDFQGCTIDFAGSFNAAMSLHGFFECIRNVALVNGRINIAYDGSAGTNNGIGIRIGSRNGYPFGADSDGVEDEDLTELMGGCVQRDIRITSNNPSGAAILLLGGLDGNVCENVYVNGTALVPLGIYYEFGFWHYEATVANRKSSHATNLYFKNLKFENMKATTPSTAFSLVGAMSAIIDGVVSDGGYNGIVHRCGEALYYNMGTPWGDMRAHIEQRNIVITDTVSTAFSNLGAESKSGGSLSAETAVTEAKQCDLISFSLDGFSIEGTMVFSGRSASIKNGVCRGGGASGGILLQDELMFFEIDNVRILDAANIGLRWQIGTNITNTGTITAATSANPIAFTMSVNHGWLTGQRVVFASLPGDFGTNLNGNEYAITVTGVNTFTIAVNGGGYAAYTTGGTAKIAARIKSGTVRNSMIAGSVGVGANPGNADGTIFDNCRFGYELVHDGIAETTQTSGVSNGSTARNTTIRNPYGGGSTGNMYINGSSGGWKNCKLESPGGIKTLSGQWTIDGHGMDADIGDAATTLDPGTDLPEQRYATALTANRIVTLGTGYQGAYFKVAKTTASGAFTLDVGGLKTIPNSTAAVVEVEHDGTAWRLVGYQLL